MSCSARKMLAIYRGTSGFVKNETENEKYGMCASRDEGKEKEEHQ